MSRWIRILLSAGLLALGVWPSVAVSADAEPRRGQLSYNCVLVYTGLPDQPTSMDITASLQVDVPASMEPGQSLSMSGTFSVQVPEQIRGMMSGYFPTTQAVSDALMIPVSVGGSTTLLRASHFDSGVTNSASQPLVLSGTVSLDPFLVPADASGELVIGLPINDSVPSITGPGNVAFTAEVFLTGGLVPGYGDAVYRVSCTAPGGADGTVARIAISAPAAAPAAAAPAAPAIAVPAAPAVAAPAAQAPAAAAPAAPAPAAVAPAPTAAAPAPAAAAPAPAAVAPAPAAAAPAPAAVAPAPAAAAAPGAAAPAATYSGAVQPAAAYGAIPPSDDISIPLSWIVWGTLAVVGSSLLFSLWSGRRMRMLRASRDS